MLSQWMYLSHLLLFSARKNRRQLQTQTLKDTRQDAACPPYKVERAGIVPQRVCDVWTASWVDCTCLGEPITRDSQEERDQNYAHCLCQEHRGNIADVTDKWKNETCAACMPMNDGTRTICYCCLECTCNI